MKTGRILNALVVLSFGLIVGCTKATEEVTKEVQSESSIPATSQPVAAQSGKASQATAVQNGGIDGFKDFKFGTPVEELVMIKDCSIRKNDPMLIIFKANPGMAVPPLDWAKFDDALAEVGDSSAHSVAQLRARLLLDAEIREKVQEKVHIVLTNQLACNVELGGKPNTIILEVSDKGLTSVGVDLGMINQSALDETVKSLSAKYSAAHIPTENQKMDFISGSATSNSLRYAFANGQISLVLRLSTEHGKWLGEMLYVQVEVANKLLNLAKGKSDVVNDL